MKVTAVIKLVMICCVYVIECSPLRRYCNNYNPFCRCLKYNNGCYECPASCSSGDHTRPISNGCPPVNFVHACHLDRNGCIVCMGSTVVSTSSSITTTTMQRTIASITTTPTITTQTTTAPITTTFKITSRPSTLSVTTGSDNYCLQCDEAVSPHTCSHVTKCGNTESCFIDMFVNSIGGIRYRLGCRDTHQCGILGKRELSLTNAKKHTHSAQKRQHMRSTSDLPDYTEVYDSGNSVVCSQCCNASLCNTGGCGTNPYPDMQLGTRGPLCFSCSQQSSSDDCGTVRLCGRNQMCKLEQISVNEIVLWATSCEDARTCQMLINSEGSNCTSTCCASDLCNHECPARCPILHCQLDCGNPPKYKKNINGCDMCLCDITSATHLIIG